MRSTVCVDQKSNLREVVDDFINSYVQIQKNGKFSYRILLPREAESSNSLAKKLGLILEAEIVLALKRREIQLALREIRYVHDEHHYGWLFLDPFLFDELEK